MFSTSFGHRASRKAHAFTRTIVSRTNARGDAIKMAAKYREDFPAACEQLRSPVDVKAYFDELDIAEQGAEFLAMVLKEIVHDNERGEITAAQEPIAAVHHGSSSTSTNPQLSPVMMYPDPSCGPAYPWPITHRYHAQAPFYHQLPPNFYPNQAMPIPPYQYQPYHYDAYGNVLYANGPSATEFYPVAPEYAHSAPHSYVPVMQPQAMRVMSDPTHLAYAQNHYHAPLGTAAFTGNPIYQNSQPMAVTYGNNSLPLQQYSRGPAPYQHHHTRRDVPREFPIHHAHVPAGPHGPVILEHNGPGFAVSPFFDGHRGHPMAAPTVGLGPQPYQVNGFIPSITPPMAVSANEIRPYTQPQVNGIAPTILPEPVNATEIQPYTEPQVNNSAATILPEPASANEVQPYTEPPQVNGTAPIILPAPASLSEIQPHTEPPQVSGTPPTILPEPASVNEIQPYMEPPQVNGTAPTILPKPANANEIQPCTEPPQMNGTAPTILPTPASVNETRPYAEPPQVNSSVPTILPASASANEVQPYTEPKGLASISTVMNLGPAAATVPEIQPGLQDTSSSNPRVLSLASASSLLLRIISGGQSDTSSPDEKPRPRITNAADDPAILYFVRRRESSDSKPSADSTAVSSSAPKGSRVVGPESDPAVVQIGRIRTDSAGTQTTFSTGQLGKPSNIVLNPEGDLHVRVRELLSRSGPTPARTWEPEDDPAVVQVIRSRENSAGSQSKPSIVPISKPAKGASKPEGEFEIRIRQLLSRGPSPEAAQPKPEETFEERIRRLLSRRPSPEVIPKPEETFEERIRRLLSRGPSPKATQPHHHPEDSKVEFPLPPPAPKVIEPHREWDNGKSNCPDHETIDPQHWLDGGKVICLEHDTIALPYELEEAKIEEADFKPQEKTNKQAEPVEQRQELAELICISNSSSETSNSSPTSAERPATDPILTPSESDVEERSAAPKKMSKATKDRRKKAGKAKRKAKGRR
ncbi:MAG: hypothetical protein M1816_007372 [Peltula sp. TS41687]|nr:MAG: hypothetical protein M1816_007372 [Peltula sp. TS41687]